MYNSNITDEEVKQFHWKVKVNGTFSEIGSAYFKTDEPNKEFPLFYCDKITGNSNVRIIDNKLIIYKNSSDLQSLNFISDTEKKPVINITHKIVTVNNRYFLKLHFYNNFNFTLLRDYPFHINQTSGINGEYTTDQYGNSVIELTSTGGTFTVTTQDGQTITWSEE